MSSAPAIHSTTLLNDQLVADILRAAEETFGQYFNLRPHEKGHTISSEISFPCDVYAQIILMQNTEVGRFYVAFPKSTILPIISRLYGEDFATLTRPVIDGVGEISNTIYCLVKHHLNLKGQGLTHSPPPKVVVNTGGQKTLTIRGPSLNVPLACKFGDFHIVVSLNS